ARSRGNRGTGRRSPGREEHRTHRQAAHLRCRGRGRAGEEPLPGVDNRRPPPGRRSAGAARRAHVPPRGLHVAGRRARRCRLHREGGRRVRALRGRGHARRALHRPDRALARAGENDRIKDHSTSSSRRFGWYLRPTFADGRPSVRTMSAVKSFEPRMREEPTPYASTGTPWRSNERIFSTSKPPEATIFTFSKPSRSRASRTFSTSRSLTPVGLKSPISLRSDWSTSS